MYLRLCTRFDKTSALLLLVAMSTTLFTFLFPSFAAKTNTKQVYSDQKHVLSVVVSYESEGISFPRQRRPRIQRISQFQWETLFKGFKNRTQSHGYLHNENFFLGGFLFLEHMTQFFIIFFVSFSMVQVCATNAESTDGQN